VRVDHDPDNGYAAVRASGLAKRYGERAAVDGVDLSIVKGELFSLLGPNGAGKTTTINMLCCLLEPSDGAATVMGHDISRDPLAVKQRIGMSPQETAVAENLSAKENLALIGRSHGLPWDEVRSRSDELLDMMGLAERAEERVKRFSGGMKRRLSIAMAMVSDPEVIFLDEPTLGLDPQARRKVWEHIGELKGEKTVLLTTHYLEEADSLSDRIAVIDQGRIVALGTPDELKRAVSEERIMVVKASNLTAEIVEGLRQSYRTVVEIEGGLEIHDDQVDVYALQDYLRPAGVIVESTQVKETTLDDVFLHLTGREYRE
jgi:ABC-2 type transport system ATP-binding protein